MPNLLKHFKQFKLQLVNRNVRTGSITVKQYDDFVRGCGDDRSLAAKQCDTEADTSALEREIDELVYAFYGLTPEEKALVQAAGK